MKTPYERPAVVPVIVDEKVKAVMVITSPTTGILRTGNAIKHRERGVEGSQQAMKSLEYGYHNTVQVEVDGVKRKVRSV